MGNSSSNTGATSHASNGTAYTYINTWSLLSPTRTSMEASTTTTATSSVPSEKPPAYDRPQSFEERLYSKFVKQPLVPLGCLTTAYFLVSGIKSFKNRDPRRAQKMMRARVGAQFATLLAFVGYMGFDSFNLEAAPAYKRQKAVAQWEEEEQAKQQNQQQEQQQQPQKS